MAKSIKKWFLGVMLAFFAGYLIAFITEIVPAPGELLCNSFGTMCKTTFNVPCAGSVSTNSPSFDCPFVKYRDRTVTYELGLANASGGTYTVILLTEKQAEENAKKAVPECALVLYPWVDCSSGYGGVVLSRPLPSDIANGNYVLRIAYRNKSTDVTARIKSE